MFIQGQYGNDVLMGFNRLDRATANKPEFFFTNRWTGAGSTNTWFKSDASNPYIYNSDLMVFDGSFMKIRQLQLGRDDPAGGASAGSARRPRGSTGASLPARRPTARRRNASRWNRTSPATAGRFCEPPPALLGQRDGNWSGSRELHPDCRVHNAKCCCYTTILNRMRSAERGTRSERQRRCPVYSALPIPRSAFAMEPPVGLAPTNTSLRNSPCGC